MAERLNRVFVVEHHGLIAHVLEEKLRTFVQVVDELPQPNQKLLIRSVKEEICNAYHLISTGHGNKKVCENAANDFVLWLANEVLEGRFNLETGYFKAQEQITPTTITPLTTGEIIELDRPHSKLGFETPLTDSTVTAFRRETLN